MNDKPGCSVSGDSLVLLTIALMILKAMDLISCSWWWVFAPIWIPIAIAVIGIVWLVIEVYGVRR